MGVKSIQPIVLTFIGTEACVPLRLTAIAANPDMPVRIWVLADGRSSPRLFRGEGRRGAHRLAVRRRELLGPTKGLLSQAANEAGGTAFVTEYAGPSSITRQLV